jgi:parallel beta-helix repeat protein
MSRELALLMTLTLLVGILGVAVQVQKGEATATIHIMADGSIDPPTANITSVDNVTYTFIGNINESIVVERDNIVVDGNGCSHSGSGMYALNVTGLYNVTIRNMNITYYRSPFSDYFTYGIYIKNSNNITVINIHIERAGQGIVLISSNDSRIESVTIPDRVWTTAECGIRLQSCNNITISHSQITSCFENIVVDSSHNNVFIGNNVTLAHVGNLLLEASSNNIITDNIFADATSGQAGAGLTIMEGGNNIIRGNTISNNVMRGVEILDSINNTICNNLIRKNWFGIVIQPMLIYSNYSRNNTIYNNLITENNCGVKLYGKNNRVFHNNFIDNKIYASAHLTNSWDDGVEGNYWSNYNGTDSNNDGVGDSWVQINENNTDHYPLMAPYIPPAQMRVLYYDLMEELNELQLDCNLLNQTYQELLGNTTALQGQIDSLNSTLQEQIGSLNSTVQTGQENILNELNTIRNIMYIFIGTTVILIVTIVYLVTIKPKTNSETQ